MKKIAIAKRMKPRRRFTTEKAILAKIDDCHIRSQRKRAEAEAMDKQADEVLKKAGDLRHENERASHARYAKDLRREAGELRVSATRLIEVRAKKLGERLSEFRTELLPCISSGPSVPVL